MFISELAALSEWVDTFLECNIVTVGGPEEVKQHSNKAFPLNVWFLSPRRFGK